MAIGPVLEPRVALPAASPSLRETSATPAPPATTPPRDSPFARLMAGLGNEVQRGEALVRGAIASAHGGELDPAELIALQAGVYRYSEAVDLAAKLVDHATGAVKTVVQGQ